ncbi:MAG: hypothetical protein C0596_18515 [Marinilabiliales bacterium]|nr:MAG: hypothetical protein C0596_18515 [Marinilabiliales bacterium]
MKKTYKTGFKLGLGLFIIGVLFAALNHGLLEYVNWTLNIFVGYPLFLTLGLAFIIAPGPEIGKLKDGKDIKKLLTDSKSSDKIIWILFSLLGIAGMFVIIYYYGLQ